MTLRDVTTTVSDGNLGILPQGASRVVLYVGAASVGTANTVYSIGDVAGVEARGEGPAVEAMHQAINVGGGPLLFVPCATSVGTKTAVTQSGAGPVITLSGDPLDEYDVKVQITAAGILGVSKLKISLDGGRTYSDEAFTAASYPISGTGITLTMAAGTYVLSEIYSFTTTAPSFSTSQLNAALDAAFVSQYEFGHVYVAGPPPGADDTAKATASAAFAAALQSKLDSSTLSRHKYTRGTIECPKVPDASLQAAFASVVTPRVGWSGGFGRVQSTKSGRQPSVPVIRALIGKVHRKPLGKSMSEMMPPSWALLPASVLSLDRDEFATPGLDASRFITFRTIPGRPGFYLEKWRLGSLPSSDFQQLQHGQVIDEACRVGRGKALDWLSYDLEYKEDGTGQLTDAQASVIEDSIDAVVRLALVPKDVVNVQVRVSRTNNVLSTSTLLVSIGVLPKGYADFIELTVGFTNQIVTEN